MDWLDYTEGRSDHSVVGRLRVLPEVYSPQLENARDILVYLPPSYGTDARRYPVLYMHDGQNLFDAATSYAGEWQVDETLQTLSGEGVEALVVGIPNIGERRMVEYNPFNDAHFGAGQGERYVRFLFETVKPIIDADFATNPARESTGIMGSSMGGLISLYALFRFPDVFGMSGVMSPSLHVSKSAILDFVASVSYPDGKIYLDVGTHEGGNSWHAALYGNRRYVQQVRRLQTMLVHKGYHEGSTLLYVEDEGAIHHEREWARRLPNALRFLLGG